MTTFSSSLAHPCAISSEFRWGSRLKRSRPNVDILLANASEASPSKCFLHSGIGPSFLRTARHITAEICLSLLVGHAKGTIPDCLIRGLGDLTGWSIAKPIRVVLPYLHVSWQMTSVPLREAVRYSGSVRAASASPLIRLIHDTRIHDTRIHERSFFLFPPSISIRVNRSMIRTCTGISSMKTRICLPGFLHPVYSARSNTLAIHVCDTVCTSAISCVGKWLFYFFFL